MLYTLILFVLFALLIATAMYGRRYKEDKAAMLRLSAVAWVIILAFFGTIGIWIHSGVVASEHYWATTDRQLLAKERKQEAADKIATHRQVLKERASAKKSKYQDAQSDLAPHLFASGARNLTRDEPTINQKPSRIHYMNEILKNATMACVT